jgi:hypothetical protein
MTGARKIALHATRVDEVWTEKPSQWASRPRSIGGDALSTCASPGQLAQVNQDTVTTSLTTQATNAPTTPRKWYTAAMRRTLQTYATVKDKEERLN